MNRLPEYGKILLQKASEDAQIVQALVGVSPARWGSVPPRRDGAPPRIDSNRLT